MELTQEQREVITASLRRYSTQARASLARDRKKRHGVTSIVDPEDVAIVRKSAVAEDLVRAFECGDL